MKIRANLTNREPAGGELGREVCAAVPLFAWFLGPVRWVVQKDPGLSYVDLNTWSTAFKEYGFAFCLVVGATTVLYLSSPYLWAICLKLYGRVRHLCLVWNDNTKTR
ncbi:MAG: hypothetical protein M0P73_15005 [Syntrophobacterales bacterium]|jgi:hypothetical protein|nr:hypothetical protein [Syntrophobacterales bacterium]